MIDTEYGSGDLYSHLTDYDIVSLEAPHTPERYLECLRSAEKAGYNVLIIDSFSHAWVGEGGLLDIHHKVTQASQKKDGFAAWRTVTPMHNKLVNAILASPLHIICTLRSETEYAKTVDEKTGKTVVEKLGLAPVQRKGVDYEFTVALDLCHETHIARASKDRTSLFDGKPDVITENTGKMLLEWLNSGKEEEVKVNNPVERLMADTCNKLIEELKVPEDKISKILQAANAFSIEELNDEHLTKLHNWLLTKKEEAKNAVAA